MSNVRISLQVCKLIAPNCGPFDPVQAIFKFTDAGSNEGTVTLSGTKTAINSISHTAFLDVNGVSGSFTLNTPFPVSVVKSFPIGFEIYENIHVEMDVVDCAGYQNVEPATGLTNAIMTHENKYLMDHEGKYIAFV